MKKVIAVILLLAVLATAGLVYAATVKCPIDGSMAYFTGKSKTDVSGKLLYEYKCMLFGHLFWVVQN